jgi:hypothetical protein
MAAAMMQDVVRTLALVGFLLVAAFRTGYGLRAFVAGRAFPKDVRSFGSVRRAGVASFGLGLAYALFALALLLINRWAVAAVAVAVVGVILLVLVLVFAATGRRFGGTPR